MKKTIINENWEEETIDDGELLAVVFESPTQSFGYAIDCGTDPDKAKSAFESLKADYADAAKGDCRICVVHLPNTEQVKRLLAKAELASAANGKEAVDQLLLRADCDRLEAWEPTLTLEESKKKRKKKQGSLSPFSSMTVTTGDPDLNIKFFNKMMGTDFESPAPEAPQPSAEAGSETAAADNAALAEGAPMGEQLSMKDKLFEAKRYVKRYYIRPQNIFCSNKEDILKALISVGDANCSVYSLKSLEDHDDVHLLKPSDIIYYYDDGILYDKNHVKVMDYDLFVKHEEERKKFFDVDKAPDAEFSQEYDDRLTDADLGKDEMKVSASTKESLELKEGAIMDKKLNLKLEKEYAKRLAEYAPVFGFDTGEALEAAMDSDPELCQDVIEYDDGDNFLDLYLNWWPDGAKEFEEESGYDEPLKDLLRSIVDDSAKESLELKEEEDKIEKSLATPSFELSIKTPGTGDEVKTFHTTKDLLDYVQNNLISNKAKHDAEFKQQVDDYIKDYEAKVFGEGLENLKEDLDGIVHGGYATFENKTDEEAFNRKWAKNLNGENAGIPGVKGSSVSVRYKRQGAHFYENAGDLTLIKIGFDGEGEPRVVLKKPDGDIAYFPLKAFFEPVTNKKNVKIYLATGSYDRLRQKLEDYIADKKQKISYQRTAAFQAGVEVGNLSAQQREEALNWLRENVVSISIRYPYGKPVATEDGEPIDEKSPLFIDICRQFAQLSKKFHADFNVPENKLDGYLDTAGKVSYKARIPEKNEPEKTLSNYKLWRLSCAIRFKKAVDNEIIKGLIDTAKKDSSEEGNDVKAYKAGDKNISSIFLCYAIKDLVDDDWNKLSEPSEEDHFNAEEIAAGDDVFKQDFDDINAYGEKVTEGLEDTFVCCICGEEEKGYGNNPAPVRSEGRCCDACNIKFVIPARMAQLKDKE